MDLDTLKLLRDISGKLGMIYSAQWAMIVLLFILVLTTSAG